MKTSICTWKSLILFGLTLCARTALADTGYAYAWIVGGAAPAVAPGYSLNPGGGAVTVVRVGTGVYNVNFPNSGIATGWSVLANAEGETANYCNVGYWNASAVNVQCYNPGGAAADSKFTVLAVSNANDKNIAFAYADQPALSNYNANASYSFNPGGSIPINRVAAGIYIVGFSGLNGNGGTIQVNAYGSGNTASCYGANLNGGGAAYASVQCFDPAGNYVDSVFVVDIVPSGVNPAGIAYSLAYNDTTPSYTLTGAFTYNPTGGAMNATRSSAGEYVLTFAGLNAFQLPGGIVQAVSFGNAAPVRCSVVGWEPVSGSTLQVMVNCYNVAGGPRTPNSTSWLSRRWGTPTRTSSKVLPPLCPRFTR